MIENIFGIIAFITSFVGLFPQIYKAYRTRSTEDISLLMVINFLICSFAWVIYGYFTNSFYVVASNVIGFISCVILMFCKARYDKA